MAKPPLSPQAQIAAGGGGQPEWLREAVAQIHRDSPQLALTVARTNASALARVRRLLELDRLVPRLVPPFEGAGDYHLAMHLRLRGARELADVTRARAAADEVATRLSGELGVEVDRVWERAGLDSVAGDCLSQGLAFAGAGAAAGAILGPIGAGVAAAVGFLVGVVLGLIPFAKMDALDRWRRCIRALSPLERCLVASRVRDWADDAATAERQGPWPAWRWGESGGLAGHTLYGDRRSFAVFLTEIVFEELGEAWPSDGAWREYALAWLAGNHEDDKPLSAARHLVGKVREKKGPAWLCSHVEASLSVPCGELRARALAAGLADFRSVPDTPGFAALPGPPGAQ